MQGDFSEIILITVVGTFGLLILAIAIIVYYRAYSKKKTEYFLEKQIMKNQFSQALLQTQIEIQEQTLKTISQEIHDNIGQVLSLAKLNLNTLEPTETEKLKTTKELVSKAINDLRNLSRSMHGDKIAELGLLESVKNELQILQNTGQFKTTFKVLGEPYKLQPQEEIVLFRILQESMNNAIKHSRAKNINVEMLFQPHELNFSIIDDGVGFDSDQVQTKQMGIGLKNMQNRAALICGIFTIKSSIGKGTKVNIEFKK